MDLAKLILLVVKHSNVAVHDYTRGAERAAADDLAFISNKITEYLPNCKLPPAESSEPPGPAGDTSGGP